MKKRHKTRPRHKQRGKAPAAPHRAAHDRSSAATHVVGRSRAKESAWEFWFGTPPPSFRIGLERLGLPRWSPALASARAAADAYRSDEREALALLLLPFLLLAFGIGMSQSIRPHRASDWVLPPFSTAEAPRHRVKLPAAESGRLAEPHRVAVARDSAAPPPLQPATPALPRAAVESVPVASLSPIAAPSIRTTALAPASSAIEAAAPPLAPALPTQERAALAALAADLVTEHTGSRAPITAGTSPPADAARTSDAPTPPLRVAVLTPDLAPPIASSPTDVARPPSPQLTALATARPRLEPAAQARAERPQLAALAPSAPAPGVLPDMPSLAPLLPDLTILARPERPSSGTEICAIEDKPHLAALGPADVALSRDPALFGERLAQAARGQLDDLVVYNDAYRRISYPMGDVPAQFGVCTDVVIRAYRALGIDLQALVHAARAGSGDTNIDHRRVETLRRFLATRGTSLPVTDFPEDYRPGDIVTYYRPQNRHSRSHIAIVSDVAGPSGRPMILHNRGWGVQLEDGLFVDQITGHYRFAAVPGAVPGPQGRVAVIDAASAGVTRSAQCMPTRGAHQPSTCRPAGRRHLQARSGPLPHAQ